MVGEIHEINEVPESEEEDGVEEVMLPMDIEPNDGVRLSTYSCVCVCMLV